MTKEDELFIQEIDIGGMLEKLVSKYSSVSKYVKRLQGFEYERERATVIFSDSKGLEELFRSLAGLDAKLEPSMKYALSLALLQRIKLAPMIKSNAAKLGRMHLGGVRIAFSNSPDLPFFYSDYKQYFERTRLPRIWFEISESGIYLSIDGEKYGGPAIEALASTFLETALKLAEDSEVMDRITIK